MNLFSQGKEALMEMMLEVLPEGKLKEIMLLKDQALQKAPKIALIGSTGVGKTSTINALFNCDMPISHIESCTKTADPIVVTNKNGYPIVIIDMPGLDEGEEEDEKHRVLYERILPECDAILWIVDVCHRGMKFQQMMIREVLNLHIKKLVIAANKADTMSPNNWNNEHNIPSREQEINLEGRINDIKSKLCKVHNELNEDQIIYYSTVKEYRLQALLRAMLDACPESEAWILASRVDRSQWTVAKNTNIKNIISNLINHDGRR